MISNKLLVLRSLRFLKHNVFYSTTTTTLELNTTQIKPENVVDLNEATTTIMATTGQNQSVSFAKLFRNSKFVQLGELKGRLVVGRIVNVFGDDLYIDFGGKFNCVCKKPEYKPENYKRNTEVILRLNDFEMASHFLGAAKHLTLLEADAELVGLYRKQKNIST